MIARNQQHLQSILLDPLEGRRIPLSPDIFDQRVPAWVHYTLHGRMALISHCKIFSDVQERARFQHGFRGCE